MLKSNVVCCIFCHKLCSNKGIISHFFHKHGTTEEREKMARGNLHHTKDRHKTNRERAIARRNDYLKNPRICKQCKKELSYEKRTNNFCSSSCAATYNNVNHTPGRKFGPKKTKPIKVKLIREPKITIPKIKKERKPRKIKWKDTVVGPFSKLFKCECHHCSTIFITKKIQRYCVIHQDVYSSSRSKYQFTFNVYEYPDLFDLNMITVHGWYSPGNRGPKNNKGVSRDHRVSVHEAVKNNYDPYYITHPLNCEIMLHSHNKSKYITSSMSYEKLIELVSAYEMAKGSGIDPHPLSSRPTT